MLRTMGHTHLSDDRLLEVCLDAGVTPPRDRQHLEACVECEGRRAELARVLSDISAAVTAEADAAFPAERLARQQARILQQLAHDARPGRVIAFPAGHASDPLVRRTRPAMRWIAGAAAAGLVIGVLAGHLAHDFSITSPRAAAQMATAVRPVQPEPTLQAVATTMSEDEFLGMIELAIEGSGSASLGPMDDLTPRVWEVTSR